MSNVAFKIAAGYLAWAFLVNENCLAQELAFEKVVLDPQIGKVCYAVTAADVDGDSRLDPVAISEREAFWFRNPDWKKHTMISDAVPTDHVCIVPADIDRDGKVDFAFGAGWPRNGGTIHWMKRGKTLNDPWQIHPIAAEAWTHRMRMADVLGQGRDQLVVTPLNATTGNGIRLLAFPVPDNPASDSWKPIVVDGSLNRAHNHWHLPSGNAADETIVASQEGLTRITRNEKSFSLQQISAGAESEVAAQRGAGEVKNGILGDRQLLATIEPMHGNHVVVYIGEKIDANMKRVVLDDTFKQGHAIWCVDLDGDGRDEVIAAHREKKADGEAPGIYLYRSQDADGQTWMRQTLDQPVACEDIHCADFDGDGSIDILTGGRATHDVNLYLNRSAGKAK
ncbi:MAG: VCBS repeat-containing protein [Rubripirellula sp.]|nr:VCBS repeat-containing protein [Rubripirellula sp.]